MTDSNSDASDIVKISLTHPNPSWETYLILSDYAKDSFSSVLLGSSVYLFAGYYTSSKTISNSLQVLNLKTSEFKILNENILMPKARISHSLVLINHKLYLFGGINSGVVFNDIWIFDFSNFTWQGISAKGAIPLGRYSHAAGASGDAFVIWGGKDLSGFRDDIFIFNSITQTWTELFPSSALKPRPAYGACMVFRSPLVYLYGGVVDSDISNELWKYDLGTNNFSLVSNQGLRRVKYSFCFYNMSRIFVALGSMEEEEPSSQIDFYDLEKEEWKIYHFHEVLTWEAAQASHIFVDPEVVRIGGEMWMLNPNKRVDVFGPSEQAITLEWEMDMYIYAAASAYFNKSIYIFGGGTVIGKNLRSEVAHNLFLEIKVDDICEKVKCKAKCSPGTYESGETCTVCPQGRFASGIGNTNCSICPSGTYNNNLGSTSAEQCLPCPEGRYNNAIGANSCSICPKGMYCPVGSKLPMDNVTYEISASVQPPLYKLPKVYSSMIIYQVLVSVPLFIVLILFFVIPRCRSKLRKLDMFDNQHSNKLNDYVITKKTLIGGCFSFLFVIGTFLLIGSTLISYFKDNINESKGLIPLVVLESEASSITSEELSIQLWFDLYGGECEENSRCLPSIQVYLSDLYCSNVTYSCELKSSNSCKIVVKCRHAEITKGSQISVSLTEKLSYASGIRINLTSSSSVPDQISSVYLSIKPSSGKVFIGSAASEFYFIATPSLFKSESSSWPSEETGYHISTGSTSKAGNQVEPENLPSVSYLFVNVFIETSASGLLTLRLYKQDFIYFVSSILGSASGLFGIAGFVMSHFEKQIEKLLDRRNEKMRISAATLAKEGSRNVEGVDLTKN